MSDICAYFLSRCMTFTSFQYKKVLWIGAPFISNTSARKMKLGKLVFLSGAGKGRDYLEGKTVYNFSDKYVPPAKVLEDNNFAYYDGTVSELNADFCDGFDIVVIMNETEHIGNFSLFLDNIYKVLRWGGEFFAKPGRIWSAVNGSEWKINQETTYLTSKHDVVPAFPHLLSNFLSIYHCIKKYYKLSEQDACSKAHEILNGSKRHGLNRYFYEDYKLILSQSLFHTKEICPLGKIEVSEEMLKQLREKYIGYEQFEHNTLFLHCKK